MFGIYQELLYREACLSTDSNLSEAGTIFCTVPAVVLLALPGVSGLNAAEHLRSLYPKCGIIWCSDLDFSLHAFRMRIEYFFMKPVEEQKIKEGLSIWFERRNVI